MISAAACQTKGQPTPLYDLHRRWGARLVDFAGYRLPVQYKDGILAEHRQTRRSASLFDVSHMGQAELSGAAAALERIFPADLIGMKIGQMRYTFLLNETGGIVDDLMICRRGEADWRIIVNGACKAKDFAYLRAQNKNLRLTPRDDLALLALQGPQAAPIISAEAPDLAAMNFMTALSVPLIGEECFVSRSGYTGEDGYEISVPASRAESLAAILLKDERLLPAGLGARDTLRLEAGLCLYGQDIDETVSPIEAGLSWAIAKRRRQQGGFIGAEVISQQLRAGVARCRAGFRILDKRPVRHDAVILDQQDQQIGIVTSGGVAADCPDPIAMGYVAKQASQLGTQLVMLQRGRRSAAEIVSLPFRPHHYFRKKDEKHE